MTDTQHYENCSFCGKHKDEVSKLIVGNEVAICNECVTLCQTLLEDEPTEVLTPKSLLPDVDPLELKAYLDQYVIGQDRAKITLSVAVANHYKRIASALSGTEIDKANILMLGPTGSGKTLLARTIARYLDVPFTIADATSVTEAGYVGDDVESLISRLYAAADGDVEKTQRGIVFIDEIDKIARKGESSSITRDVSGEGVQQALLKIVEGTVCRIMPQGGRKHPGSDMIEIDTKNILFIAGGAFVGIDKIISSRINSVGIGFNSNIKNKTQTALTQAAPDDFVKFGLIPEFVGRFPSWVSLDELTISDLVHVLTGPKNSLVKQYQHLFAIDKILLDFDKEALETIAERSVKFGTGARALHSEVERVLTPHMFYIKKYQQQGINHVVINKTQINNPMPLYKE
jgi:ATP-dependent Clp protease ATP-binding subunit ClpX